MIRWLASLTSVPAPPPLATLSAPPVLPGFDRDKAGALGSFVTKTRAAHVMATHGYDDLARGKLAKRPPLTAELIGYARTGPGTHAKDLIDAASLAAGSMPDVRVDDGAGGTITTTEQLARLRRLFPEYAER